MKSPAVHTPAGRPSERSASRRAQANSNMRHSGRGRPVRRTLDASMRDGSADPSTREARARQLRDEVKSGGNQPTHIRVIHRRPSAARGLNSSCRPPQYPAHLWILWTSPSDRHAPCGPWGPPVDNAGALPTADPHSRASRPQIPQDRHPCLFHQTMTGPIISY